MEVEIPTVQESKPEMSLLFLFLLRLTIAAPGWRLTISFLSKVVMNFAEASSMMRGEEISLSHQGSGTFGTQITEEFAVLMKILLLPVTVTIELTPMAQLLKQSKRWPSQSKPSSMVTLELGTLPQQMVSLL